MDLNKDKEGRTSDAATRSGPRKQNVGATGATPATRTAKLKTTDQLLADAEAKIKSPENAIATLRGHELIPAGGPTVEGLISGLLHLAAKSASALVTEGLVAFAIYAKAAVDDAVSSKIADSVLARIEAQAESLVAGMEDRVARAGEQLQDQIKSLSGVGEAVESRIEQAVSGMGNAGGVAAGRGASSSLVHGFSYADAARAPLPGPDRAAQIKVADRERLLARQILVDGFPLGSEDGAEPTAAEILAKANDAAGYMLDAPEDFRFTAARSLSNGGVILETPLPVQALWLREHAEDFERVLGENTKVRQRPFRVVVEFVPITFDPRSAAAWRETETALELPLNSIADARWIKPVERRHRTQRFAHLLLTLTSPAAANTLISTGLTIAGKHVYARKNLAEPMRCAKCHRYDAGHLARDCPQHHDTCGTCGRAHRTRDCTRQEPTHHRCANCKKDGHAAWSRDCPVFLDQMRRTDARHPENRLRFFPTADPDSWVPRLDDAPTNTLWNIVQDSIDHGPPPPSQRRRAAQASLTQSTLNFSSQGSQPVGQDA